MGNIVNPLDLVEKFGADAFHFLMREMNVGQDSDFSLDLCYPIHVGFGQ
ncbi:MAG: hypothetical protein ACLUKN_00520 [Bacilli bacterium]